MTYRDEWSEFHVGDAPEVLQGMPERSVHCAITSPPYWGLRSYLPAEHGDKSREIGAEPTPEAYVENLVDVFRGVWRVLRDDGTLWVNLGDAYNNRTVTRKSSHQAGLGFRNEGIDTDWRDHSANGGVRMSPKSGGLKEKDLIGLPWMLAFALRADGWYLRADVIWAKDSCMPESVTDRPTRSHEHLFLLTKKPRYFYDAEAVREPHAADSLARARRGRGAESKHSNGAPGQPKHSLLDDMSGSCHPAGRNLRDVWRINPRPYPEAHYAVFPPELVYPCVKAGTSERGVCGDCGAPWVRVVERTRMEVKRSERYAARIEADGEHARTASSGTMTRPPTSRTVGWEPSCACNAETVPATVLDPFAGSGTTLYASRKLGRRGVGIDLDERNAALLEKRLGHQGVLL